jgi:hypothetical protein
MELNDSGEYFCPADNRTFIDISPILFSSPTLVNRVHRNAPRFGHTSDIDQLISGSSEEGRNYVVGVLSCAIAMFIFFLLWIAILAVFKCMGPKRVGLLSGYRVYRPEPPAPQDYYDESARNVKHSEDDEDMEAPSQSSFLAQGSTKQHNINKSTTGNYRPQSASEEEWARPDGAVVVKYGPVEDDTVYRSELQDWKVEVRKVEGRLRNARIVVVVSGLCSLVFIAFFYFQGIHHLQQSFINSRATVQEAVRLADDAVALIDNYSKLQSRVLVNATEFAVEINNICPLVKPEICSNFSNTSDIFATSAELACDITDIPNGSILVSFIEVGKRFLFDKLDDIQGDLEELSSIFKSADENIARFSWAYYVAAGCAGLLAVLVVFMMKGVLIAWKGKTTGGCARAFRRLLRSYFLVPAFLFVTFMSWVFSMIFVLGSVTASDMCVESPDPRMTSLLKQFEHRFNTVVYEFATYYVAGCPSASVPLDFEKHIAILLGYLAQVSAVSEAIKEDPSDFLDVCGGDPNTIDRLAFTMQNQVCLLTGSLYDIQEYFACDNWHPLYRKAVYDAVCYNGTAGLHWVALSQFFIVTFAMVMLTLRVAFYELEDEKQVLQNRQSWIACLSCGSARRT